MGESRPRRVRVGAVGLVLTVVVAAAWARRWWTQPAAFGGLGDAHVLGPAPVSKAEISTTVVFPKTEGPAETVTITPTRAGSAHLGHVDLTYQRGATRLFQRGTETIEVDRLVTAR